MERITKDIFVAVRATTRYAKVNFGREAATRCIVRPEGREYEIEE